ncbi:MAG: hypothetical protein GXY07_07885 [Candidatus Hydrogenedentes bacterium]|jgi:hypothetical protein|nr:hypothetical protein [Candidatus Hydrogenedentota bacterium]
MKYFKTAQFVPNKGDAWTYYECDDSEKILRQMTHIPETGEIDRIPDPIVKKLYRPEMLQPASEEEFLGLWNKDK